MTFLLYPRSSQIRGFAPGQSRRIFSAKKILSTPSFGKEVKPPVPCRSFTACKRSLNVTCKSAFRQNSRTFFAHSFTFRRSVLSRGDTRRDAWRAKVVTSNPDRTISLEGCSAKLKIIKYDTLDLTEDYKLVLGRRQMQDKMNKIRDKERGKADGKSKRNKK